MESKAMLVSSGCKGLVSATTKAPEPMTPDPGRRATGTPHPWDVGARGPRRVLRARPSFAEIRRALSVA
jgi:hypothetical protein